MFTPGRVASSGTLPRCKFPFLYVACVNSLLSLSFSGLMAFATTTLVLSLYNVHARHIAIPNVIVGLALFYGGLAQFLAGMWEFATGNTFGATGGSHYPFYHW